jgi:putative Holliday junction resolvase
MNNEIKNYLGIDWGEAKIGLAIADEETRMAFCFDTLRKEKNPVKKIIEIIKEENIKAVVIGIPSHINRIETVYEGEKLGEKIKKETGVEICYQDEMFTTKMAQINLIEKGVKRTGRFDDQEAARIILQEWLDNQIR